MVISRPHIKRRNLKEKKQSNNNRGENRDIDEIKTKEIETRRNGNRIIDLFHFSLVLGTVYIPGTVVNMVLIIYLFVQDKVTKTRLPYACNMYYRYLIRCQYALSH